jgi:hypothetical protein
MKFVFTGLDVRQPTFTNAVSGRRGGEPKANRLLTPVNDGCIGDCHHGMISRL